MFAHTDTSQAKGREFLGRFMQRQEGRDAPTSDAARDAQYDAIVEWGIPDHAALQRLTGIDEPDPGHPGRRRPDDPDQAQPPDGRPDPRRADSGSTPTRRTASSSSTPTEVAAEVNAFLRDAEPTRS